MVELSKNDKLPSQTRQIEILIARLWSWEPEFRVTRKWSTCWFAIFLKKEILNQRVQSEVRTNRNTRFAS